MLNIGVEPTNDDLSSQIEPKRRVFIVCRDYEIFGVLVIGSDVRDDLIKRVFDRRSHFGEASAELGEPNEGRREELVSQ